MFIHEYNMLVTIVNNQLNDTTLHCLYCPPLSKLRGFMKNKATNLHQKDIVFIGS